MRRAFASLALGLAVLAPAAGRAAEAPVVVELFTSQGCSSCPPADAFLRDLARQRKDVLALSFHVTYWNYLGWRDPYSFDAATARQKDYARALGEDEIYTPQMVIDGRVGIVGSDRAEGTRAIAKAAPKPVALRLMRDGDSLRVTVGGGAGHARVLLVGYDAEHTTPIGRGENGGRTLTESNIVRSLTQINDWNGTPAELQRAVPDGETFAVLLQSDDGRIIGAARLEKPTT